MSAARKLAHDQQISPRPHRDRRLHKRVSVRLPGRFLNEMSEEHAFTSVDVSCGGARLRSTERVPVEARIVCYFEELGRVACKVTRQCEDGFAVIFLTTPHKRDKLADRLTWLVNREALALREERAAPRYEATGPALISLQDGRKIQCRVLDISLSGAGLEATTRAPMVGEIVTAGTLKGEVVRSQGRQFGIRWIV